MAEFIQWEYRAISVGSFWNAPKDEDLEIALNHLGDEGWEVISVFTQYGHSRVRVVARRPLSAADRRRRDWPA